MKWKTLFQHILTVITKIENGITSTPSIQKLASFHKIDTG